MPTWTNCFWFWLLRFRLFVVVVVGINVAFAFPLPPLIRMYVCVCIFSLGKLDINNVQIKSSSPNAGANIGGVFCFQFVVLHFLRTVPVPTICPCVFMRWPYRQGLEEWGVCGVWVVGCALLCHATGEITCLTLRHASLSAIRFVVISHKNTFRIRFSDFWTLNSLSSHSAQHTGGLITLSSMEKCIDRALSHVDFSEWPTGCVCAMFFFKVKINLFKNNCGFLFFFCLFSCFPVSSLV